MMCSILNGYDSNSDCGILVIGIEHFIPITSKNVNLRATITKQNIIDQGMSVDELLDLV